MQKTACLKALRVSLPQQLGQPRSLRQPLPFEFRLEPAIFATKNRFVCIF